MDVHPGQRLCKIQVFELLVLTCTMRASYSILCVATTILLGSTVTIGGCRRPRSPEQSQETRQARAQADREAALEYLKEDGRIDWRKRIDAASGEIDEAKSHRRWGRREKALEHALRAAQLLPPPSKDFDVASANSSGYGDQDLDPSELDPSDQGDLAGDAALPTSEEAPSGRGDPISNAEVQRLRESIQSLLKSLDGKAGRGGSGLSFERDAIEIR